MSSGMRLGRIGWWRHGAVAATVAVCGALAAFGIIGTGDHDERFDAKLVVVEPAGADGVQITEVVDVDFAYADRHGYERLIPNDFGVPTDISAASPNAPDDVSASQQGSETRIRIGDPGTTVDGRHRYVLRYTLPDARISTGSLALDIIGTEEDLETGRFEVVVTGFQLESSRCNVGRAGASGGCELRLATDGTYRAVIEPLEPGDGITIGGTITGAVTPVDVVAPAPFAPHDDARLPVALGIVALGATGAGAVYAVSRRRGRNEVFGGGGAADAAFGRLPTPGNLPLPATSTSLVSDDRLGELATIEFVPPTGIAPWQGALALRERLGDDIVAAWFSGQAAADVIELEQADGELTVRPGSALAAADPATQDIVRTMFNGRDQLQLGTYDSHFARAWREVRAMQAAFVGHSGWWTRRPTLGAGGSGLGLVVAVIVGFFAFGLGSVITALVGAVRSVPLALVFGLVVPAVIAWSVYGVLRPARSGTGSAVALRTESFRRFLAASEGRHVEWAWKQGLLREYSAWAVSLGAAEAWGRALASSNVPPRDLGYNSPMLVYSMGSSMSSSRTAPSSSGSGGSGGFSGGFSGGSVGGGGGGGSSGSW